ncbi:Bis-triphosphatase [Drechmeria coniospora]|uniref:Bis(5'-adenosyl)-triphosphatase n=1 Tax=Drechmeria coniospora TaxID=98403 RepID=A0A151GQX0_DRECN|nr:Bis-triphosphatase [Drechmeria coniospora]KYK59451.1 Bis-triphosphatase [Drechmeria coniospora]ODA76305.1 hypothetical protein RJ55_08150 [Drechmeria coniospora]
MSSATDRPEIKFGPYEVTKQIFLVTAHSFALVNLKPIVPGHILVCPRTAHLRLTDLSAAETADLFTTVQRTQRLLGRCYFSPPGDVSAGGSFTVAVQDGVEAGQTVPHVHVHVIPRTKGDMGASGTDAIYDKMAAEEGNVGGALWDVQRRPSPGGGMARVEDAHRSARTAEQMEAEANRYRALLEDVAGGK